MRIYVGNLSYGVTEEELRQEFTAYGTVESVYMVTDRYTGRPRGFAFVEMPSRSEAEAAIAGLNGKALDNRTVTVNEARPRPDSGRGGSYGGRQDDFRGRGQRRY